MKAKDIEKVLSTISGTVGDSLDHLAESYSGKSKKLGDEYEHLLEFAGSWKKLPKKARRLFVEQFLRSSALVVAGSVAAKAGLKLAGSAQKDISKIVVNAAEVLEPLARQGLKRAKKKAKRAKKKLE